VHIEWNAVNLQLASLLHVKSWGLWTDDMKLSSEKLNERKSELERKQKRLATEQTRKQKARRDFKRRLNEAYQNKILTFV